jgi:hypothetical protein
VSCERDTWRPKYALSSVTCVWGGACGCGWVVGVGCGWGVGCVMWGVCGVGRVVCGVGRVGVGGVWGVSAFPWVKALPGPQAGTRSSERYDRPSGRNSLLRA